MPTYDYACTGCGPFEALRRIADRDGVTPCPRCGRQAARMLGAAVGSVGAGGTGEARRLLIGRHERALADGQYRRMRHALSCGCCR